MPFQFGPFSALDINSIEPSWWNLMVNANKYNLVGLNKNLRALDKDLESARDPETYEICTNPIPEDMFRWTWSVPVHKVKVVICGHCPTNDVQASGLAFQPHDDKNVSTTCRNIFDLMAERFGLNLSTWDGHYNFDGWIEQGVLLVNAIGTRDSFGNYRHDSWIPIMQNILNFLYNLYPDIVFLFAGGAAGNYFDFLSQRDKGNVARGYPQRVVNTHHPSYGNQFNDHKFPTFAKGLSHVRWLLWQKSIRMNFLNLDMWRNDN